jgi:hypothetical protein
MNEQNSSTATAPEANGTTTPEPIQGPNARVIATDEVQEDRRRDDLPKKLFGTHEEAALALKAISNPPKGTKVFRIAYKGELKGFILAIGYDPAISRAAQTEGWSASTSTSKTPVTVVREMTQAEMLAKLMGNGLQLTAAQKKALGL